MTGKQLGNQPAFPSHAVLRDGGYEYADCLTKREYFAGLMRAAMIGSGVYKLHTQQEQTDIAVEHADALLDELARKTFGEDVETPELVENELKELLDRIDTLEARVEEMGGRGR